MTLRNLLRTILLALFLSLAAWAATLEEIDALLTRHQLEQAETEIRKLMEGRSEDAQLLQRWGYLLLLKSQTLSDPAQAKAMRKASREALAKAKALGNNDPLVSTILDSIPPDGGDGDRFSNNPEVEKAMKAGETAFAGARWAEAAGHYERAEKLDPKLYFAPLYLGDAHLQQGQIPQACQAYERATKLDPDIETAYRYWGNALMRQGAVEQALERYAQAVVADPGSQMAWERGLRRWTEATGAKLAVPKVTPRAGLGEDGNTIVVDAGSDEFSAPWLAYAASRLLWRSDTYPKQFPGKPYRHTLAEETEALNEVASVASELAAAGKLKPDGDLSLLIRLQKEGLMEPFVLFSRADQEIIEDFESYRQSHRDKLVKFLVDYVVVRDSI